MKQNIVLIGGGGHCRSVIDVIEQEGRFEIVGVIDTLDNVGKFVSGYPIVGDDSVLPQLLEDTKHALITIGQVRSPESRMRLFSLLKSLGFSLPVVVSPRAYVAKTAQIGEGTVVMHDALINACSVVGDNCIVNSKALIEHDAIIGDHCHVSTGAIVNGGAEIKLGTFYGSNAVSKQGAVIDEYAFIKAGSVVV